MNATSGYKPAKRCYQKHEHNGQDGQPICDAVSTARDARYNPRSSQVDTAMLHSLFHVPVHEAAKRLGLSVRTLQRLCKKNLVLRWPYRQIRVIDKRVNRLLCTAVSIQSVEVVRRCLKKIVFLQMKKIFVIMTTRWRSIEAQQLACRPLTSDDDDAQACIQEMARLAVHCIQEEENATAKMATTT